MFVAATVRDKMQVIEGRSTLLVNVGYNFGVKLKMCERNIKRQNLKPYWKSVLDKEVCKCNC